MKTKIIQSKKNPFLKREEITVEITSESAPTASEIISKLGYDDSLTVVKKINTNFGRQIFLTEIVIYDNPEAKKSIETIPQKIRKKMEADKKAKIEEAKKKAAAEAEAKKAEEEAAKEAEEAAKKAPKEEEKEEPKEESKEKEEANS